MTKAEDYILWIGLIGSNVTSFNNLSLSFNNKQPSVLVDSGPVPYSNKRKYKYSYLFHFKSIYKQKEIVLELAYRKLSVRNDTNFFFVFHGIYEESRH